MRVLVAPDKFAGTLSAVEAAAAIAEGWARTAPGDAVVQVPLADGGPGFVEVLATGLGGEIVPVPTTGPLGEPALAALLIVDATAYIESAQACGLHLLPPGFADPERPTTTGVADLLVAAVDAGARTVVVGVGGTATTDGGRGMVERFGELRGGWPDGVALRIATDVDNPLIGPLGAAPVFAPQKGADSDTVDRLEARLTDWLLDTRGSDFPGAGAGGGLGYATASSSPTLPPPRSRSLCSSRRAATTSLRVAVQPGGCSGLRYQLFFDERTLDGDVVKDFGGVGSSSTG
jgi:glycerate 2-kinase